MLGCSGCRMKRSGRSSLQSTLRRWRGLQSSERGGWQQSAWQRRSGRLGPDSWAAHSVWKAGLAAHFRRPPRCSSSLRWRGSKRRQRSRWWRQRRPHVLSSSARSGGQRHRERRSRRRAAAACKNAEPWKRRWQIYRRRSKSCARSCVRAASCGVPEMMPTPRCRPCQPGSLCVARGMGKGALPTIRATAWPSTPCSPTAPRGAPLAATSRL